MGSATISAVRRCFVEPRQATIATWISRYFWQLPQEVWTRCMQGRGPLLKSTLVEFLDQRANWAMRCALVPTLFQVLWSKHPVQTLKLSRSSGRRNLRTRRKFGLLPRCLLLFAFGIILQTTTKLFRVPGRFRHWGEGGKGESHGPLQVSGDLTVSEVLQFQAKSSTPNFDCPVSSKIPVFVALSTIPSRKHLLEPAIRGLLNQTFPVHVLLSIPEEYPQFPAADVRRLHEYVSSKAVSGDPRVHILTGKQDLGPATKLLYPLSRLIGQTATVIVVDDDQEYSPTMACDLVVVSADYPKSAITRRSRVFPRKHCSTYVRSSLIAEETVPTSAARVFHGSDLVMGTSGYLVKTSFFGSPVFDFGGCPQSLQNILKHNDDIWVSGHLRRQQVDILVALSNYTHALPMRKHYKTSRPEVERQLSRRDGLWSDTAEVQRRTKALRAFFGSFCVPTRMSLTEQQPVCNFHWDKTLTSEHRTNHGVS